MMDDAKAIFMKTIHNLDKEQWPEYLKWINKTTKELLQKAPSAEHESESNAMKEVINGERTTLCPIIDEIRDDLRSCLPQNAILPSENILFPTIGEMADCDPSLTVHVDAFLYDDDLVDELCDEGRMTRNYCEECGSHKVKPLTFISHSMSCAQLQYIFRSLLGDLHKKTVVDVGSRVGAILYGAYLYSSSPSIYGVEINTDLCKLQQKMVDKYRMGDRIRVVCDDVCNQGELIASADVLILNNVFEFFVPLEIQARIWEFLHKTVRKAGCLIVMSPSIEQSLYHLEVDFDWTAWVEATAGDGNGAMSHQPDEDMEEIYLYEVKGLQGKKKKKKKKKAKEKSTTMGEKPGSCCEKPGACCEGPKKG